jgi:hypothetical protein
VRIRKQRKVEEKNEKKGEENKNRLGIGRIEKRIMRHGSIKGKDGGREE